MSNLAPLSIDLVLSAFILLVFVADLLLPANEKRGLGALAALGFAATLGLSFVIDVQGESFGGAYATDSVAIYLKRIFLLAGFLGSIGSISHTDARFTKRQGEYYVLLMASVLGMCLLAGAQELVFFAVAFELMGIPLYMLVAIAKTEDGKSTEAALKLYLVGAASSAITLYGLSLIYGSAGTTVISELANADYTPIMGMGIMAAVAGMAFKIGVVPFHMWIQDTYEGAPTPFVAFLSVAPKAAGFAALIRLFLGGLIDFHDIWFNVLIVLCALTMLIGNFMAIPQDNVKRLLGGSGIAHMGYMLLAFALGTSEGIGMLLFYLLVYVFTNMGVFFIQEIVSNRNNNSDDITAYRGMSRTSPGLALAMLLLLLSLGGIPFMAGFWAKFYVFMAAWHEGQWIMVILGAGLAVMGLFYYLRIGRAMYVDEVPEDGFERAKMPISLPLKLGVILSVAGIIGLGIYPRPFVEAALEAARLLM